MVELKDIEKLFVDGIMKYIYSQREVGIHVTTLVYGCPRYVSWAEEYGNALAQANIDNWDGGDWIFRIWIGQKLHETPLTDMHEVKVHYEYGGKKVVGSVDEIWKTGNDVIVIDKKFVKELPREMYEHHRKQVQIYSALLRENGIVTPNKIALVYFRPMMSANNPDERFRVFVEDITSADMDNTIELIKDMIDRAKRMEKRESFFCKFCPYADMCKEFEEGNIDVEFTGVKKNGR